LLEDCANAFEGITATTAIDKNFHELYEIKASIVTAKKKKLAKALAALNSHNDNFEKSKDIKNLQTEIGGLEREHRRAK
jgi:hypothetical protein